MDELTLKEKIESDYYVTKLKYPDKSAMRKSVFDEFDKTFVGTRAEYEAKKTELLKDVTEEYNTKLNEYYNDRRRLKNELKLDLENEFGTGAYPKKDIVFKKAWDDANDNFEDVYFNYLDLVEVLVLD